MSNEDEDQVALRHELAELTGPRQEAMKLVREGLPDTPEFRKYNQLQRDAVRYRMGLALMWDRETMLRETGWSLKRLGAVERHVLDEEVKNWGGKRNENIYAEYRLTMGIISQETASLGSTFRANRQYDRLLPVLKMQADILDRLIKTGQELGVIDKAAQKIEVNSKVETRNLTITEMRARIVDELEHTRMLIESDPRVIEIEGPAGTVFNKMLAEPDDEPASEPDEPKARKTVRVPRKAKRSSSLED